MAIKCHIIDDCIACGSCAEECPVDAISEGDIYVVDPAVCEGCSKCAEVCPVDACILTEVA
ncbi:MAG: 4Fe-4S binding protein [Deltaproteobacteria bacterium]|nr:4Fe-4S binding protein [bacterium]MCB9475994.1 4Fe-4S binding protein [Deltaproteobacteria bacterium]MCB9480072.1 4Fe-4S binding protein [Deltaproteobacteria bacterium]MCB9487130.1 4Fe-4S binding protein [Deltaproteobacteria bacterium]